MWWGEGKVGRVGGEGGEAVISMFYMHTYMQETFSSN